MADLSITAASVLASSSGIIERRFTYGATVTAGQQLYLNSSNQWVPGDSNAAVTGNGVTDTNGISLNGGASGQPADVLIKDLGGLTLGATLTVGQTYVRSSTAGGIAPISDLTSLDYTVILGVAKTAALLIFQPLAGGAAKP
jgi:hypothetical protein